MSQTTNNRGNKNPNRSNKDFFNSVSGDFISFADLKAEIEAGKISPTELYTDYERNDASADQAKQLMEIAIKKTAKTGNSANVQAIIDKANSDAKAITDKANSDAKAITDKANSDAKAITDKANSDAKAITDKANSDAKAITDKAKIDAKAITDKAAQDTAGDKPVKPDTKKSAKPEPVATGSIDALKLVEYVDDEAVIDVRVPGMSVDKIVAAINGKAVASKGHLEILGKYGLPVGILPVRKVGKKLVIAKKSADELSLNTIDDIIAAIAADADNK